jgi:glyoxylase-like metal-dependent hydrolase (beta-lactamase superfamily II)
MKIAVNCYLIQTDAGYFLIDTGLAKKRARLVDDLQATGCQPGDLKLILLTHGDFDHSGNSAYLRDKFGAKIAMHSGDLPNVKSGDMFANKKVNPIAKAIAGILFSVTGMSSFDTFTPDLFLEDGQNLSSFGLDATVIHLPGHSKGSVCFLTAEGDLFCGDLLVNTQRPSANTLADDLGQLMASVEKLQGYPVKTVYPGHGRPFPLSRLYL